MGDGKRGGVFPDDSPPFPAKPVRYFLSELRRFRFTKNVPKAISAEQTLQQVMDGLAVSADAVVCGIGAVTIRSGHITDRAGPPPSFCPRRMPTMRCAYEQSVPIC